MNKLSAGVQILLTQLKENPDAFFGPITHDHREGYVSPKFAGWRQAIEEELIGLDVQRLQVKRPLPATWFLSDEEKEALADAYTLAKRERFDAEIIFALNAPPEEPQKYAQVGSQYAANLARAVTQTKEAVASSLITGTSITAIGAENTARPWR